MFGSFQTGPTTSCPPSPPLISILWVSLCSTVTEASGYSSRGNGGLKGRRSDSSSIWVQHSSLIVSHSGEGKPPPPFEWCSSRSLKRERVGVCVLPLAGKRARGKTRWGDSLVFMKVLHKSKRIVENGERATTPECFTNIFHDVRAWNDATLLLD